MRRPLNPWLAPALLCAALAAWLTIRFGFAFSDYDLEASASVDRLLHADVAGFLRLAPAYGGSLILRSPMVLLARATGGGELAAYWLLAVPGLAGVGLLAASLVRHARGRGWSRWACALAVGVALLSPPVLGALDTGHAEELLGAALTVGAMLAAMRGRWLAAGLLLGLAVANKPWALVAVVPVLVALPARPLRAALVAGAVAAAVMAPLMLAGGGVTTTAASATSAGGFSKSLSLEWFLGRRIPAARLGGLPAGTRQPPAWVSSSSRPAMVLLCAALSLLWWRRRSRAAGALGLLALALLLRSVLDPWNMPYYHLPFLLALLAWETHSARRGPYAALTVAVLLRFVDMAHAHVTPDVLAAGYAAMAIPGLIVLGAAVLAPEWLRARTRPLGARLARALPNLAPLGPETSAG